MVLCQLCASLPLQSLPALDEDRWTFSSGHWKYIVQIHSLKPYPDGPLGLRYHSSLQSLRKSVQSCDLCGLISRAVEKVVIEIENATEQEKRDHNAFFCNPTFRMWITRRRYAKDGLWVVSSTEHAQELFLLAAVSFCVDDGTFTLSDATLKAGHAKRRLSASPLAPSIPGRPIEEVPTTEKTMNRAAEWVHHCNEKHADCSLGVQPLPNRLVSVGLDDGRSAMRLCDTAGQVGQYTTLSYCWGSTTHFVTTKATLGARKLGIDIADVPKTVQDAIYITRRLRIPYIWVDCICICQDDAADWDRESAQMAAIYSNSYLNIAATAAKESSSGLFHARRLKDYVELPFTASNGVTGKIAASLVPAKGERGAYSHIDMDREPLSQRAWAFQERVISRRVLHYASHQMYFECLHGFRSEDGLELDWRYLSVHASAPMANEFRGPSMSVRENASLTKRKWHASLEDYGSRKLTRSSDKLPALSGIAKTYGDAFDDQYLAGLWRKNLVEELVWKSEDFVPVQHDRAPSWSWAAVDGRVEWGCDRRGNIEVLATMIDARVELKAENPFGEVTSGRMEIHAPRAPLILRDEIDPDDTGVPYSRKPLVRTAHGDRQGTHAHFDADFKNCTKQDAVDYVQRLQGTSISALILARSNKRRLEYHALIVTPLPGEKGTVRRLGYLDLTHDALGREIDVRDPLQMSTVVIV